MRSFYKKLDGSILIFVLACISALGTVLVFFSNQTIIQRMFYSQAAKKYGFFDKKETNKLRGLVDLEADSLANLTFASLWEEAASHGQELFKFIPGQLDKSKVKNDGYDFKDLIKNHLGLTGPDIRHNFGLDAKIKIFPIDHKLPFSKKFKKELVSVFQKICNSNNIDPTTMISDFEEIIDEYDAFPVAKVTSYLEMRTLFRWYPSWANYFARQTSKETKLLEGIWENVCFSKRKNLGRVNLLLASRDAQQSLWKVCYETLPDKIGLPTEFKYDEYQNLILEATTKKESQESLDNKKILGTIMQEMSHGVSDPDKRKVFLSQEPSGEFFSFSKAAEVEIYVYDKDGYEGTNNIVKRYVFSI